nr:MAG: hypothetical protein [Microvirus sp.]
MQNIGDVVGWMSFDSTQQMGVTGNRAREIVVHVNAPYPTLFAIEPVLETGETEEPIFLARVEGFDTLKFNVPAGPFNLLRIDGGNHSVHIRTADGQRQHRENVTLEKFTQIHERRQLSPEYQYVLDQVQKNAMRNMQMMGAELEDLRRQVAEAHRAGSAAPTGEPVPEHTNEPAAPANPPVGTGDTPESGSEGGQ